MRPLLLAPRIPPPLLRALARIDDPSLPIAEACRRLGTEADRLGVTRPSYERVRVLVWRLRVRRQKRRAARLRLDWRLRVGVGRRDLLVAHATAVGVRRLE